MAEMEALRAYVTAPGSHGQNQADSTVRLHVTHSNLKLQFMELRLDKYVRAPLDVLTSMLEGSQTAGLLSRCTLQGRHLAA